MVTSTLTCLQMPPTSGKGKHHDRRSNTNNNSRSRHMDQAAFASTNSTCGPTTGYDQSSYLTVSPVLSLDIASRPISPCLSDISETKTFYSTLEVTEIPTISDESSNEMDIMGLGDSVTRPATATTMATATATTTATTTVAIPSTPPDSPRTPKRKRTGSPPSPAPSSKSPQVPRSASRSTRCSGPNSRRSSPHSRRRATTTASLAPSIPDRSDPETKRESLLALHRDACRLFQDNELGRSSLHDRQSAPSSPTYQPSRSLRTSSEVTYSPASPILYARLSIPERGLHQKDLDISQNPIVLTAPIEPGSDDAGNESPKHVPATVIDWTSPSTRRREYEKIDRASTGVRGFWRRVAPKWCHRGDRMPFFEEGKDGKGNHEGSVRRFRMDIPDEPSETGKSTACRKLKFKKS